MPEAIINSRYSLNWAQNSNSIGARTVALGTWNVVRVGLLWSVPQAVSATIQPDFAFGLCSGTAAVYGDASATHFVGVTTEGAAFGGWAPNGNDFFISGVFRPTKQVGVVKTNGTNLTVSHVVNASDVNNYRSVSFVEFTKGSPNYSFKLFHRNLDGANDFTVADLTAVMESGAPALSQHTFTAAQTLAVDEGVDGTLDAVQFYWSMVTPTAEIDAIMVSKIS